MPCKWKYKSLYQVLLPTIPKTIGRTAISIRKTKLLLNPFCSSPLVVALVMLLGPLCGGLSAPGFSIFVLIVLEFDLRSRCLDDIFRLTLLNGHPTGTTTSVTRNTSNAWFSQATLPVRSFPRAGRQCRQLTTLYSNSSMSMSRRTCSGVMPAYYANLLTTALSKRSRMRSCGGLIGAEILPLRCRVL